MAFTNEQLERYSRHIILKEVGAKGQKKLLNASVLIIGAGGLGAPAAMYLAAAGVGTIGIVDADEVDLSNLQRQIIHSTADIGKAKVKSAKETMEAINPDVTVKTYREFVTSENVMELIKDYDFIIDGTDNFPAKFIVPCSTKNRIISCDTSHKSLKFHIIQSGCHCHRHSGYRMDNYHVPCVVHVQNACTQNLMIFCHNIRICTLNQGIFLPAISIRYLGKLHLPDISGDSRLGCGKTGFRKLFQQVILGFNIFCFNDFFDFILSFFFHILHLRNDLLSFPVTLHKSLHQRA